MNALKLIFDRFKWMVIAGAVIVTFHYLGSVREPGILLGCCFTIIFVWLYDLQQVAAFKPYSVTIYVNFQTLRDDFGLLKADKAATSGNPMYDVYEFRVITSVLVAHYRRYTGTSVTELNLLDRWARSYEEYQSQISFADELPCALNSAEFVNPGNRNPHPRFFFRAGSNGYEFGIHVVPEWWFEQRKLLRPEVRNFSLTDNLSIILAVLPYGYIPAPAHVRARHESDRQFHSSKKRQGQGMAKLAKHGWTVDEYLPDDLHHRYLLISYQKI